MANEPRESNSSKMLLVIAVVVAVLALAAWQFGLFGTGQEGREVYKADVTDQGGGELIVTEQTPAVPVELPETPMTNVPPEASPSATPTPE